MITGMPTMACHGRHNAIGIYNCIAAIVSVARVRTTTTTASCPSPPFNNKGVINLDRQIEGPVGKSNRSGGDLNLLNHW
jgi:hypothetical protein